MLPKLALAASLMLAASPAFAAPSLDLSGLQNAITADLMAADADAKAHGDTFASNCYEGVMAWQAANPIVLPNAPVGVASTFQAGRDVVKGVEAGAGQGIPPALVQACGPLALDVQSDLGKAATGTFSIFGVKLF